MPTTTPEPQAGLRDAVVGNSSLSSINGDEGKLIYCGYDIHELARGSNFEETAFLLWNRRLPTTHELRALREQLSARRSLPPGLRALLATIPRDAVPMDALRTAVSALGLFDPAVKDMSSAATMEKALHLTAVFPTILAAHYRLAKGLTPIEPRPDLDTAANFLYMMDGQEPDAGATRVLDVALVLHADHGMNASTFAAIVTAATLSDMYSAVVSAIGALKGPLHGGANEGVIDNLLAIGSLDRVDAWVADKIARHEKIMGFGHAVYRAYDPRAIELKRIAKEMQPNGAASQWVDMTERMERAVWERKALYPNVDLYSASVYYTLGIPTAYFTPVFAMSRVAGWCAHVIEQYADNKLIRPRSHYVGPRGLSYVPIEKRSTNGAVAEHA